MAGGLLGLVRKFVVVVVVGRQAAEPKRVLVARRRRPYGNVGLHRDFGHARREKRREGARMRENGGKNDVGGVAADDGARTGYDVCDDVHTMDVAD